MGLRMKRRPGEAGPLLALRRRLVSLFRASSTLPYPVVRRDTVASAAARELWTAGTIARGLDPDALVQLYDFVHHSDAFAPAYSLIVTRTDCTAAEGYFRRRRGQRPTNIKSVTKSVLSLLVGIAIDEGCIAGVDATLGDVYRQALATTTDPRKRDIRLRDLLTMQAGLQWDEWAGRYRDARDMLRSRDSVAAVIGHPLAHPPGETFCYSTGTSQILAGLLAQATGMSVLDYANARLFRPLGIERVKWLAAKDGLHCGGAHLFLTPRDMAKIGRLCLHNGRWVDRQIVPERWIADSTRVHAGKDWWEGPYGYHWWIRPKGYCAYGYGGQFIYVVPSDDLVIVLTANPNRSTHIALADFEAAVVRPCLAAVRPTDPPRRIDDEPVARSPQRDARAG
jgi:CubicO group peptidase (beta-lactamase class C family)